MKKLLLIALSTSLAMGANAADDKKFYAGGAGSLWKLSDKTSSGPDYNLSGLEAAFGYEALPWLALEVRAGLGVERQREDAGGGASYFSTIIDDPNYIPPGEGEPADGGPEQIEVIQVTDIDRDVKAELNYYASFYLKPQIKNDVAVFYGLIGYTTFDAEFTVGNTTRTDAFYTGDADDPATWAYLDGATSETATADEYSESDGSFSMGFGVGFYFKERYVFNIEYKNLIQSLPIGDTDTKLRANGVTFAVNYSF
ncbi:MAG TPA: outer membrane beta-barrel protein [Marinagarivorans sp.]